MTYTSLIVHLQLGQSNTGLLRIAGDLAERFQARLIGIAACQPLRLLYNDGYMPAGLIEADRQNMAQQMAATEAEFRTVIQPRAGDLAWRSTVTLDPLSDYLAAEARNADLVITGVDHRASSFDLSRSVNIGDLVMQVGRPVLVVPAALGTLKLERIVVGWKDTRESRRAAIDALPFLKRAAHVAVVEIADEDNLPAARSHLRDVVAWLRRHGVEAEPIATPSLGDDAAQLIAIAGDQGADVIVAGAYGHTRLREWALGGVTRDLLRSPDRCSLLSH
jgi:nucleotide-binding universal stress UspA family protein